tara:strand:- start:144 stop:758 length:615 start_codon:yes stop_codon:yes gene_type:complete
MAKRSNLYEIYFGPISRKGHGYGISGNDSKVSLGSEYTLGGNFGIYDEPDTYDVEDLEDIDNSEIISKIDGQRPYADLGHKANRQSNYTGAYTNLAEKKHTTTAVQGISPNMTYRTSKGGKATKTAGNSTTYPIIYQRPRVDMPASRYGTGRAPLPRHNELDNNPIFSLDDLLNRHEVALHKHTTNVNRIRNTINEINDNFYDI